MHYGLKSFLKYQTRQDVCENSRREISFVIGLEITRCKLIKRSGRLKDKMYVRSTCSSLLVSAGIALANPSVYDTVSRASIFRPQIFINACKRLVLMRVRNSFRCLQ